MINGHETKHDKFRRVGSSRVTRALKSIRLVGNLSSKDDYEYTDVEVAKIKTALSSELDKAIDRFNQRKTNEFQL
jgi:hypothetical protein